MSPCSPSACCSCSRRRRLRVVSMLLFARCSSRRGGGRGAALGTARARRAGEALPPRPQPVPAWPAPRGRLRLAAAAACGRRARGRVVFAGRVAGEGTVSVRCGRWRVSYAPLTRIACARGRAGRRRRAARALGGRDPLRRPPRGAAVRLRRPAAVLRFGPIGATAGSSPAARRPRRVPARQTCRGRSPRVHTRSRGPRPPSRPGRSGSASRSCSRACSAPAGWRLPRRPATPLDGRLGRPLDLNPSPFLEAERRCRSAQVSRPAVRPYASPCQESTAPVS